MCERGERVHLQSKAFPSRSLREREFVGGIFDALVEGEQHVGGERSVICCGTNRGGNETMTSLANRYAASSSFDLQHFQVHYSTRSRNPFSSSARFDITNDLFAHHSRGRCATGRCLDVITTRGTYIVNLISAFICRPPPVRRSGRAPPPVLLVLDFPSPSRPFPGRRKQGSAAKRETE